MQFEKKISQLIIKPMLFCGQKGFPGHERRWRPQEEGQVQVSSLQEAFSYCPTLRGGIKKKREKSGQADRLG